MIPWFIVHMIGAIAALFSRDVYVHVIAGKRWCVESIYLKPSVAGQPRPRRLAPWDGTSLAPGEPIDLLVRPDPAFAAIASPITP